MGSLEVPDGANGSIERFGATTKIGDALYANFTDRGCMVATLVLATLTETPYTPEIDGRKFEIAVSNSYAGLGDNSAETPDTVDEAREALTEFLTADVAGSKRVGLESYKTEYTGLLEDVLPGRKTPHSQRYAFEEALVEHTRSRAIQVASPQQALEIIRQAPRRINVLSLTANVPRYRGDTTMNQAVTEDGRIVDVITRKQDTIRSFAYERYLPRAIPSRGGRAPGSRIVSDIERRIIDLRTGQTKR